MKLDLAADRYLNYMVKLVVDNFKDKELMELVDLVFRELHDTKIEYDLENEFIYKKEYKITRNLVKNKIKKIKEL